MIIISKKLSSTDMLAQRCTAKSDSRNVKLDTDRLSLNMCAGAESLGNIV
jgi:hypothetical protein